MLKKSQKHTDTKETKEKESKTKSVMDYMKRMGIRGIGLFLAGFGISLYIQGLPLVIMFLSGYMQIPLDGTANNADIVAWSLSSLGVIALLFYGIIVWLRFVWRCLIADPMYFLRKRAGKQVE